MVVMRPGSDWTAARSGRFCQIAAACLVAMCLLSGCAVSVALPTVATSPTSSNPQTVSLRIERGDNHSTLAIAPIYFGSKGPFSFVVDTGASVSLISRDIARQLRLPPAGSRQPVAGVGGTEQIVFVSVSNWRADRLQLPSGVLGSGALALTSGASSLDGLLGSDMLSQFGRVTIDYDRGTMTVSKSLVAQRSGMDGPQFATLVTCADQPRRMVTGRLCARATDASAIMMRT